jgi:hypothetical protein
MRVLYSSLSLRAAASNGTLPVAPYNSLFLAQRIEQFIQVLANLVSGDLSRRDAEN